MYELRPYQKEAKEAILGEWEKGRKHTLLVLPTGCGKTIVFTAVAKNRVDNGGRVLVLAHREELLMQAADKIKQAIGIDCAEEKASKTCIGDPSPIVVGSVQTMSREARLEKFDADYFDTIIVDEAHHCLTDSYQRVLGHFPEADVLGVTATPDRADKRALSEYFDSTAYEYSLRQAIKDGYLCEIRARMIPLRIDLSEVHQQSGDFAPGEVGSALYPYLRAIADQMRQYCVGKKTVVFLPLVATSQRFREMLEDAGFRAAEIHGGSKDRAEVLEKFNNGEYDVLCNAMLLTEGWDCPSVDCIVVLRPTRIRSFYQQMVGRGTRISPGKDGLLILDFLWLTARHDLCRPSSLIARKENIARRIDKRIENGDEIDIVEAEEREERDAQAEREAALAKQLAEMRQKKQKLVDPLQYAYSIEAGDISTYSETFRWERGKPAIWQVDFLERRGIYVSKEMTAGLAQILINRLEERRKAGLATPKQIRCLERYGFVHVGTWMFSDASRMISRIADNRWRVPRGIAPKTYVPGEAGDAREDGRS